MFKFDTIFGSLLVALAVLGFVLAMITIFFINTLL